jgi:hypothetical protein
VSALISLATSTTCEPAHLPSARRAPESMSAANEATFRLEKTGWMILRCRRHTASSAVSSPSPSIMRNGR